MVARADLEPRAANCDQVAEMVSLAREALADPADAAYARELLEGAEGKCQFPSEFVEVAEMFAGPLADAAAARELYGQAEDMCFDGSEFLAVGTSMARVLGDKEKSRELIDRGIGEITDPVEIAKLATLASNELGDEELAATLYAKLAEGCKSIEDYRQLAEKVLAAGDADGARTLYTRAERHLTDVASRVEYAKGASEILGDTALAARVLGELEGDCQFPAEFVALARGYKTILGDDDRVGELMGAGAEFAISGEEHLDLARGYFELMGDRESAAGSYRAALSEVTDRTQLLEMARRIAADLGDFELAREVYAKAESKTTTPQDLVKLGFAVMDDTGDGEYAGKILARAEEKMTNALDFINLGGQIHDRLKDPGRAAAVFRKGLAKTGDYAGLAGLLEAVSGKLSDPELVGEILVKMEAAADTSAELLQLNDKVIELADDAEFSRRVLHGAEERVSSLNELKAVAAAVARDHGDDTEWNGRIAEKLAKRESNQALYNEFQAREKQCTTPKQTMALAAEIIERLDDVYYARKLLSGVEQAFTAADSLDFSLYRKLIEVVDGQLGDSEWAAQLLDRVSEKFNDFSGIKQLVDTACALTDRDNGRRLAARYLDGYAASVAGDAPVSTLIKLARVRLDPVGDRQGALELIDGAGAAARNHLDLAALGRLAAAAGDESRAFALYDKAADACTGVAQRIQLVRRLAGYGVAEDVRRRLYAKGDGSADGIERLRYAEGIIELFRDLDWAREVYDDLAKAFDADEAGRNAYRASRKYRLERRL